MNVNKNAYKSVISAHTKSIKIHYNQRFSEGYNYAITKKNNISNDIIAFSKIIPYIHIKYIYIYSGY